jgi:hypothetical protein
VLEPNARLSFALEPLPGLSNDYTGKAGCGCERKRERNEGRQVLFSIRLVDFETIRNWECVDADGSDSAHEVREYFVPDFSRWKDHDAFEAAFARLLKDLRASAEPASNRSMRVSDSQSPTPTSPGHS